jgi:hypothetical protein
MEIERYYPQRTSLNEIKEPYKSALDVLNTLYMDDPAPGKRALSYCDVIDYYTMSCVKTIAIRLTKNMASFPSVFRECKERTFVGTIHDSMSFSNFFVNEQYEQAAIFGAVYYVLSKGDQVPQRYLDYMEKCFSQPHVKPYFQPFKDALKDSSAVTQPSMEKDDNAELIHEIETLRGENQKLKHTIEQLTGDANYKAEKHLTIRDLALFFYMLTSYKETVHINDNKSGWSRLLSRLTTRGSQNIRDALTQICHDLTSDEIVASGKKLLAEIDTLDKDFAAFIRRQIDLED